MVEVVVGGSFAKMAGEGILFVWNGLSCGKREGIGRGMVGWAVFFHGFSYVVEAVRASKSIIFPDRKIILRSK